MPTVSVYNRGLYYIAQSGIEAGTASYKCLLVNGYSFAATHNTRSDITGEVSGTGYSSGGVSATATVAEDDSGNAANIVVGSGGVTFSAVTIASVDGAIFYHDTGNASTDELICAVAFDAAESPSAQDLTVGAVTLPLAQSTAQAAAEPELWEEDYWPSYTELTASDEKIVGLFAVLPGDGSSGAVEEANSVAFVCTGNYTVDWGDGSTPENVNTGVKAEHIYAYDDTDLDGTNALVTFTASTDTVNRTGHGLTDGKRVRFFNIVTTTGLDEVRAYYVINATANSFQVSTTAGGSAVTLTSDGSAALLPYKVAVITITPQNGQQLTSCNFKQRHSTSPQNVQTPTSWLDLSISMPSASSGASIVLESSNQSFVGLGMLRRLGIYNSGGATVFTNLLYGCRALVQIRAFDTTGVTSMDFLMRGCLSIKEIPWFDASSATTLAQAFYDCASIKTIPQLDTSSCSAFNNMCYGCSSLEYLPLIDTSGGGSFVAFLQLCYNLKEIPALDLSAATFLTNFALDCWSLARCRATGIAQSVSFFDCNLSSAALDEIYTNLASGVTSKIITVTSNPGTGGDDPTIATAKGWTVSGS